MHPDDDPCHLCGDQPATVLVDDSDPNVGYYSEVLVCADCAEARS